MACDAIAAYSAASAAIVTESRPPLSMIPSGSSSMHRETAPDQRGFELLVDLSFGQFRFIVREPGAEVLLFADRLIGGDGQIAAWTQTMNVLEKCLARGAASGAM